MTFDQAKEAFREHKTCASADAYLHNAVHHKAADLIGDGLYGVDIKQSGNRFYVIEINDNPSIDAGVEDSILRDELYRRVMAVFLARIEQRKAGYTNP